MPASRCREQAEPANRVGCAIGVVEGKSECRPLIRADISRCREDCGAIFVVTAPCVDGPPRSLVSIDRVFDGPSLFPKIGPGAGEFDGFPGLGIVEFCGFDGELGQNEVSVSCAPRPGFGEAFVS
ncbi:MAG: hypothetical protein IIB69_13185, partial [Proteobacteria bacterium]|nr:hypothetical protein [Pseudomonadota bacterium]